MSLTQGSKEDEDICLGYLSHSNVKVNKKCLHIDLNSKCEQIRPVFSICVAYFAPDVMIFLGKPMRERPYWSLLSYFIAAIFFPRILTIENARLAIVGSSHRFIILSGRLFDAINNNTSYRCNENPSSKEIQPARDPTSENIQPVKISNQ